MNSTVLDNDGENILQIGSKGPVTAFLHRRNAVLYALLCVLAYAPGYLHMSAGWQAAGLGLLAPGVGFVATGGWWMVLFPITLGIFWWSMFWFGVFLVGTAAYLLLRQPGHDSDYNKYWAWYYLGTGIYLPLVIGACTTVWFTIGCFHDMRIFFRRLREESVNPDDDGTVLHGDGAADLTVSGAAKAAGGKPL